MAETSGFLSGGDYLALPRDPQPWIVRNLIPIGGVVNMFGRPKTGKSFAAIGLAHAIASAQADWLGFEVVKPGPVCYLQIDTPRSTWAERLNIIRADGYDLTKVYFADKLMAPYPFNILQPDHVKWLSDQIKALNPIITFVDTLRECHSGDENDSKIMKDVVANLVSCSGDTALALISHSRKDNIMQGEDIMNDARGSSYIAGRMDTVIKFTGKHMIYKGRSTSEEKVKVKQHPTNGLILLDQGEMPEWEAYLWELLRKNPELPKYTAAKMVEEQFKGKVSAKTVARKIDEKRS